MAGTAMQKVSYVDMAGNTKGVLMDPFYFAQNNGATPPVQLGGCGSAGASTQRLLGNTSRLRHVTGVSSTGQRGRFLICNPATAPLWPNGAPPASTTFQGKDKAGTAETYTVVGYSEDRTYKL